MFRSIFTKKIPLICLMLYSISPFFLFNISILNCYATDNEKKQIEESDDCINIKSFLFKGNSSFSDIRLKMRMKSWHSSLLPSNLNCYSESWLKRDILSLIEFYRKQGFPDVDITHTIKTDKRYTKNNRGKIIVEIDIDEGLEYAVTFKGNTFFSDKQLRKKVDLVKKGNANDSALSKAKVDIKNIYIDSGFQDVTVEFRKVKQEKSPKNSIWSVEFLVSEGTRSVVNHLEIRGNQSVSEDEIMESMLTRQKGTLEKGGYNSNVLDKDINAIELLYLSKGFLNATVSKNISINSDSSPKEGKTVKGNNSQSASQSRKHYKSEEKVETQFVDIEIIINEGIQTVVNSLNIRGLIDDTNYSISTKKRLTLKKAMENLSLRPGEPFREYMVKSDENAISMMISELGYPHVKIKSDVIFNSDKSKADLLWNIEKGKFTRFGNIRYSGNIRLKDEVIAKRLEIESGEPFSLKKVFATEKNIRESSAVKYVQVKSPGLATMEDSPDIEVVIEESKPYFVEAAIGYDTEQSFYIDTKIGDKNFLGHEIDAWVSTKLSGIGYRAETGLKKPFFLGTEIDATGSIYVEDKEELNKNFGIKSWGYESGFSRNLFIKNLTAGLNLKYENRTVYGDADIDTSEKETRNILITSFAVGYDTRDSLVRPSKGLLSSCSVDLYTGFDSDLDRFLKYQIDLRRYISPFNKVTFALRTRMGYIQPFGTEGSVAYDQLFFLGGTPNVRGFKENMLEYNGNSDPVGGQAAINATFETRIDLPADFELNCFLDTGKIDELANNLESRGFRSSIGAGFRYITPIGPVGLLYGHKLNAEDGESPGRVHFSVGYTF